VLEAMDRLAGSMRAQADQGRDLQILVVPLDIRVGVVNVVVSEFPDVGIGAQRGEDMAEQTVDAGIGGIGAVQGVVGHREANARHADAQRQAQKPHPRQGQEAADDQPVGAEVQGDEDHRFGDHRRVRVLR